MTTFDKAKTKTKRNKKWYVIKIKDYKFYIWAIPLVPLAIAIEKFNHWRYTRLVWNEEKATKILDKVLPKRLDWEEENNAFYYSMSWGYSILWRKAPLFHRQWARKFAYKLHQFIEKGYENVNYIKTIEKDYYDTVVKFTEK